MVEIKAPTTPVKAQKTEIITANSNAAVNIQGSSKLEVTPADYVIAQSTYDGNVPKGISQWIQNEIASSVESGNVGTAIENIRTTLMNAISSGVNQYIETLTTGYVSQSALTTTLGSAIGAVDAKILNVQQTFATENEAFATEIAGLRAKLGDDGSPGAIEAFIGNIAIAAATDEFASATDMTSLVAVYNEQTLRIDALDNVTVTPEGWTLGASKLATTPDNSIVGWSFSDGSNEVSEFKINAQKFSVSDGTTGYTPFSISGSNILFNGVVDFTNTNTFGTTTIDGGKITAGSITSGQIAANSITANMLTAGAVTVDTLDFSTVELRNAWAESIGTVLLENTTMVQQFFQVANDGASLSIYKTAVPTFRYSNGYSGYINMWRTATTVEFLFYDNEYGTWNKSMPVITQISSGDQKVFITIDLRGYEGAWNLNPAVLEFTYATFSAIPTSPTRVWTHVYAGGGALEIDVICSLMSSYTVSGVDIINYLNTSLGGMSTKIGRVFEVGTTASDGSIDVVLPYGVYVYYQTSGTDVLIASEVTASYIGCTGGTYLTRSPYTKAVVIYKHNTIMKLYFGYLATTLETGFDYVGCALVAAEHVRPWGGGLVKLLKVG